jgi:hypothetical protein
VVAVVILGGCSSRSPGEPAEQASEAMNHGRVDDAELAVGLLFAHAPPGVQPSGTTLLAPGDSWVWSSCSANLISPDVILTAGHCYDVGSGEIDVNPKVRMESFYIGQGVPLTSSEEDWDTATVHMTKYTVDAFVRPTGYAPSNSCPPSDLDIAVAHLSAPVTGVTPLRLGTAAPPVGAMVQTIGFGRHPLAASLENAADSCFCSDNAGGGGSTDYDQMVRRTATVPIAEVVTNYLHQTDVSQSADLPGDSGGAVLYKGIVVGTDVCGNGPTNAQTDGYFTRVDVAHDWIVGQLNTFDGRRARKRRRPLRLRQRPFAQVVGHELDELSDTRSKAC